MAPRMVLGPGYTGWCLACLEAAGVSTGGRSRTPPIGSRRARRTAHSTLQQAIVALASRRLSQSFPPQAVWQAWTARYGRALPSRREQGEPLSRRRRVPREGPLGHVVRRRGASECKRGWSSGTCDRSRERRVQLARRKVLTVQVVNVLSLAGLPWRRRRAAARASCFR